MTTMTAHSSSPASAAGAALPHGVKKLGVLGAGQMGGGIAQVAAVAGLEVVVFDAFPGAIDRCKGVHRKSLGKFVEKGKMQQADMDAALGRVSFTDKLESLGGGGRGATGSSRRWWKT